MCLAANMVRKTSSGFFSSIHEEMPIHVTHGYDRQSTQSVSPKPMDISTEEVVPEKYTQPFLKFISDNPTTYHAVEAFTARLRSAGYKALSERNSWDIRPGGKYYVKRNNSAFIAFHVGKDYKAGNGFGIIAAHIDALTVKLKPVSKLPTKAGFVQMGVAPYAGGLGNTWWDRDLGVAGRVMVKNGNKIEAKLVNLDWPIARVPTLAEHFGAPAHGPFNKETQMVPIIGLDNSDITGKHKPEINITPGTYAATQPPTLVKAVAGQLDIKYDDIINWDLELYDCTPAKLAGLDKELIVTGRIDDKVCCFSAIEALLASSDHTSTGIVKMVGCFDDEEVGSQLRQGAKSNFMKATISRIVESIGSEGSTGFNLNGQVLANSFLVSSDVTHSVNPNFLNVYLENHAPRLNVGIAVAADPNAHMTTDAVSAALLSRVAEKCGSTLQVFQIRNDSRSGGTIGPMTSSQLGCRAIDAGVPQLSMHSIRAAIGSLDPGLGVKLFKGFLDHYEEVDKEFV